MTYYWKEWHVMYLHWKHFYQSVNCTLPFRWYNQMTLEALQTISQWPFRGSRCGRLMSSSFCVVTVLKHRNSRFATHRDRTLRAWKTRDLHKSCIPTSNGLISMGENVKASRIHLHCLLHPSSGFTLLFYLRVRFLDAKAPRKHYYKHSMFRPSPDFTLVDMAWDLLSVA